MSSVSYLSKNISREYFDQQQARRGHELFNASGDVVNTLSSFCEKSEKKRLEREAAKIQELYAIRTVTALLKEKLIKHQRLRIDRSDMSKAQKYAKIGDEFNLRKELEIGYAVDTRDGVVSIQFYGFFQY